MRWPCRHTWSSRPTVIAIGLAWAYVALRVVHSLIQATRNIIMLRFTVFAIGTAVLLALLVRVLWML